MDPQTAAFVPRDDIWKIQADMARIQQIQSHQGERLSRLEQRQDEDARTKSIWGPSSPFPNLLSGTPQQAPVQQPSDAFSGFDDQPTHLIGSLHLDADDEPRRIGATSRANSVRFDESANQGHWSHTNRSSLDLLPRSGSSLGSHPLIERTLSHKSDGRQSSTGHSIHSIASRANSMGIDTLNALGVMSPEQPSLTPGLFILGAVPAIIRCWLSTKFKHETLLYAAVCTGSYTSLVSKSLIDLLGFTDRIREVEGNVFKVRLSVYLPEASVRSTSSVSSSPAHQVPNIPIDFTITSELDSRDNKAIRIVIGSDILRAHNADILFSSGALTLYDEDKTKLSTPLIRPEDESTFKSLRTTTSPPNDSTDFLAQHESSVSQTPAISKSSHEASHQSLPDVQSNIQISDNHESSPNPQFRTSTSTSSPALWGNWRRDSADSDNKKPDWTKSMPPTYQRREQGIKVLRPSNASRVTSGVTTTGSTNSSTVSTASTPTNILSTRSPSSTISIASQGFMGSQTLPRSSDEAKRKTNGEEVRKSHVLKDMKPSATSNPVGEGSAFSWMNK